MTIAGGSDTWSCNDNGQSDSNSLVTLYQSYLQILVQRINVFLEAITALLVAFRRSH